jgi:hypothetical protein
MQLFRKETLVLSKFFIKHGEKDCVILFNQIKYNVGSVEKSMTGTLIMLGEDNGFSAMSKLVGGPTAIAA